MESIALEDLSKPEGSLRNTATTDSISDQPLNPHTRNDVEISSEDSTDNEGEVDIARGVEEFRKVEQEINDGM